MEATRSKDDQKLLYEKVLCHERSTCYPPSVPYRTAFLKHVISQAEEHGNEVEEEMYLLLTDLMAQNSPSDFSFKSYNLGNGDYITMRESSNLISHGTTGLRVWQASFYFVEILLTTEALRDLYGKSILELGCGLGFVGMVMCRLGLAGHYIFTDCHEHVLEALGKNLAINLEEGGAHHQVLSLDWREGERTLQLVTSLSTTQLDYVIASDVVYDGEIVGYFIDTLNLFFKYFPNLKVLVASSIRNPDTYQTFLQAIAKANLKWEKVMETVPERKELFYYDRTQMVKLILISCHT